MPCNTAHRYFETLKKCIKVPLLNMVEITLDRIPTSTKKLTVLATSSTMESEVYQNGFGQVHFDYIFNPAWQKTIDKIILNIKMSSDHRSAIELWKDFCKELKMMEVDTILLACTDLNVVMNTVHSSLKIIDSSSSLAEAIVHQWKKVRN